MHRITASWFEQTFSLKPTQFITNGMNADGILGDLERNVLICTVTIYKGVMRVQGNMLK